VLCKSRAGKDVNQKFTTYSVPIKNVESGLKEFRLIDSPLKNGGGDDENQYKKFMQKELDKRFDMDHARSLLTDQLKQPVASTASKQPASQTVMPNNKEVPKIMGGKALKKNVEKLLANLLNDSRKVTNDG
jgi:hypothetical protein